jgi:hypothetical protein
MPYHYELLPEEVGESWPCSALMHLPGYDTKVLNKTLDDRAIIFSYATGIVHLTCAFLDATAYRLKYKIVGSNNTISGTW